MLLVGWIVLTCFSLRDGQDHIHPSLSSSCSPSSSLGEKPITASSKRHGLLYISFPLSFANQLGNITFMSNLSFADRWACYLLIMRRGTPAKRECLLLEISWRGGQVLSGTLENTIRRKLAKSSCQLALTNTVSAGCFQHPFLRHMLRNSRIRNHWVSNVNIIQ